MRRRGNGTGTQRWEPAVLAWLQARRAALDALGVTGLLEATVAAVWERNLERFDPWVAGDTATSLGLTCAENVRTLLRREPAARWAARGVVLGSLHGAVVLAADGVLVQVMKAPDAGHGPDTPLAPDWSGPRWDSAGAVRHAAAEHNARVWAGAPGPPEQPTLPGLDADPAHPGTAHPRTAHPDPARLRHLVLVWTGHPVSAVTAGWLAVPADSPGRPWLAALPVWAHGPDEVPRPPEPPVVALPFARPPLTARLVPRPTGAPRPGP